MNKQSNERPLDVLIVEDNLGDIGLIREAFIENGVPNALKVVHDGVEALAYLCQEGKYSEEPRPGVIILDLNLPKKDGREVLSEIKNNPALRVIPVIILTSSKAHADIMRSYDLHANCYVTKPVDLDEFMRLMKMMSDFWLSTVRLPS
jgi:two-component system, chemotaxis family, response regulator Rcp1